jgi:hypothetical protein
VSTFEQRHSGTGDNVGRDKIINEIKSLAPADLVAPMEMVFESLRQQDSTTAKTQMVMLKAIAQRDPEAAALMEVISIYGGLVENKDRDTAWKTVARIISTAENPIVRDVCLAALLRLSRSTERESAAKELYLAEPSPGIYTKEAFLRYYADEEQLQAAVKGFPAEEVLTGIVEGALRLQLRDLSIQMAEQLNLNFGSYNSRVLLAIATGVALNPDLAERHFWLTRPEVKERLDELTEQVIKLLAESGIDGRVHELGCSIFRIYHGYQSARLFEALKKCLQHLDPMRSEEISRFKALAGDDAHLPQSQKDLKGASKNPQKRHEWCQMFLDAGAHKLEEVGPFIELAKPVELEQWLARERLLNEASEIEEAYIRLVAGIFQHAGQCDDALQRQELGEQVDRFVAEWNAVLPSVQPEGLFELAEKLYALKLPHKALNITTALMPEGALWPSPYIVTYLKCLLETGQYKTFDGLISRVKGAEQSVMLLNFQSLKAEQAGDIESAIDFGKSMIELEPEMPWAWYRICYLLDRYCSLSEQQEFQQRIPDSVLIKPSREVKGILYFLSRSGNFKRTEARWVEWFIQDPRGHSVDLVNFHFGLGTQPKPEFDVSPSLGNCTGAVQYEQEGNSLIRLIVNDEQEPGECTLRASSQLGQLLQSLAVGESADLNMTAYKVEERFPPYVACLRLALRLRQIHNDGSDCFTMMQMPSDPSKFIPFLEGKMAQGSNRRQHLETMDGIPLYIRGHALYPSDPFKGALNCWTDAQIPKSPLWDGGIAEPNAVVLDAYSISYLAVTDLAQRFWDIGISFVIPAATQEALQQFVDEISHEKFMLLGVTDGGRLFRTTAADLRERDAHILRALRLILDKGTVVHPVAHDVELEVYTIKDGVDSTVYDAMQLSLANDIPWLCLDGAFAALHSANKHPIVNVQAVVLRAMASTSFDFEQMRHGLIRYALGALPLPLTYGDIMSLASTPNTLAGFILYKIIQNHGRQIFAGEGRPTLLLDTINAHLGSRFLFGKDFSSVSPRYTLCMTYSFHVFNHGLGLYLDSSDKGSAEQRLAMAMAHMMLRSNGYQPFLEYLSRNFVDFARGHFMDSQAISQNLKSILDAMRLEK